MIILYTVKITSCQIARSYAISRFRDFFLQNILDTQEDRELTTTVNVPFAEFLAYLQNPSWRLDVAGGR